MISCFYSFDHGCFFVAAVGVVLFRWRRRRKPWHCSHERILCTSMHHVLFLHCVVNLGRRVSLWLGDGMVLAFSDLKDNLTNWCMVEVCMYVSCMWTLDFIIAENIWKYINMCWMLKREERRVLEWALCSLLLTPHTLAHLSFSVHLLTDCTPPWPKNFFFLKLLSNCFILEIGFSK